MAPSAFLVHGDKWIFVPQQCSPAMEKSATVAGEGSGSWKGAVGHEAVGGRLFQTQFQSSQDAAAASPAFSFLRYLKERLVQRAD